MVRKKKSKKPEKDQKTLLKNLNRAELLELLIKQTKRADELESQLQLANRELERRDIVIRNAGSIAEAALGLNQVFEAADRAAQQYISNIRMMVDASELDLDLSGSAFANTGMQTDPADEKQKKAPIEVEKVGTFITGGGTAVSRVPSGLGRTQNKSDGISGSRRPQNNSGAISGSGRPQNNSGASDSAISLDIADFITSGIGAFSFSPGTDASDAFTQSAAKPDAPAKSASRPSVTQPDRSGAKPAAKPLVMPSAAKKTAVPAKPASKPTVKPAQQTNGQSPATGGSAQRSQTIGFTGMQLGQLLQMAAEDFYVPSGSAASKPAAKQPTKSTAMKNASPAPASKSKSSIPFKSSLAPANRQPAATAPLESDFFGSSGEIDFSKIFER